MQYPFSCVPAVHSDIESTLSPARLARYLPAAGGDRHLALRLYIWNARLCESLYLPMQFAEVAARNAIQKPVVGRFHSHWYENPRFINLLPARMKDELIDTKRREQKKHAAMLSQDHIVAGLSLGFWVSLMTAAYDKQLWAQGVKTAFPHADPRESRESIRARLDSMRRFRNDIAHHAAIFDRSPQKEFQNVIHITGLICENTCWLSKQLSRLQNVINDRPRL